MATTIVPASVSADHRGDALTVGDIYMAAARADHLAHCVRCREIDAEYDARIAEYGESLRRRDRRQLGLRLAGSREVAS